MKEQGNIYLCGFMGCGKSTIGKKLANKLGVKFVDIDLEIVKMAGKDIPTIFDECGEEYFRNLELEEMKRVSQDTQVVIVATGGGCLINPSCQEIAKQSGSIVYIDLGFEVCYDRIKNDENRPIVLNSSKQELYERYVSRDAVYSEVSDYTIKSCGKSKETMEKILPLVKMNKK